MAKKFHTFLRNLVVITFPKKLPSVTMMKRIFALLAVAASASAFVPASQAGM
jgi:hypothetical protein